MKNVKVVIGAGFGDEGKGLVTSCFSKEADGKAINVLFNGGPQRGHTANNHVYHAFGSGFHFGADTYYTKEFMLNPIATCQDGEELYFDNSVKNKLLINKKCRITLPHDVIINREIERVRGNRKHGSCGMGIWETYLRSKKNPIYAEDMLDFWKLFEKIKLAEREYYPARIKELGLRENLFNFSIDGFFESCSELLNSNCVKVVEDNIMTTGEYGSIIFEAGQGLLLDENNVEFMPNLTASSTGSKNISGFIDSLDEKVNVEVCYVIRSYMTRHGAGRFDTECKKEEINPNISDKTNIPNEFQGSLRFGLLDLPLIMKNIEKDFSYYNRKVKKSIAVTHLNYTNGNLFTSNGYIKPEELKKYGFNRIYKSYKPDHMF